MVHFCKKCGTLLEKGYTYCPICRKALKREYARNRYQLMLQANKKLKRYGLIKCIFCGKEIIKNRPDQVMCYACYMEHRHKTVNDYSKVKRDTKGNTIGRHVVLSLGLQIKDLVVHHLDENPSNNNLKNLLLLNPKHHAELHRLLERSWSLLLKDKSSNLENCWDSLRDQLTTAYLETKSANVIKITDIGQSASEPLNKDNIYIFDLQEEGSETMYQTPKNNNVHGEDIVQTQTEKGL